jgi:hyaluronoglucosaminidase
MQAIARLTADGLLESDGPRVLQPFLDDLRARRVRIFGDVLDMTLDGLCRTHDLPHPHPQPLLEEPLLTQKEQQ